VGIRKRLDDGLDDEVDDILRDVDADESAYADRIEGIDNAFAELTEVLEESHCAGGLFRRCDDLRVGFGFGHGFRPAAGGHGAVLQSW
jgi:hypothetical protein